MDAATAKTRGAAAHGRKTAEAARARKTGPLTTDFDATLRRVIKGAHEDVLEEIKRLRKLGIIDEQGHLLKKP